jgi:hypothetical protein
MGPVYSGIHLDADCPGRQRSKGEQRPRQRAALSSKLLRRGKTLAETDLLTAVLAAARGRCLWKHSYAGICGSPQTSSRKPSTMTRRQQRSIRSTSSRQTRCQRSGRLTLHSFRHSSQPGLASQQLAVVLILYWQSTSSRRLSCTTRRPCASATRTLSLIGGRRYQGCLAQRTSSASRRDFI